MARLASASDPRPFIRARLARARAAPLDPLWQLGDDGHELTGGSETRTQAGVLVGIVPRAAGPAILFTQRTAHLSSHAGQISLPGGRFEKGEDAVTAALREAEEEIGLAPARVEILGELAPYDTMTGYRIHPVVGWVDPPASFSLDAFEVDELFELPLAWALDAVNHRRDSYERGGRTRHFYVLPFAERRIWGATAGILVNLARVLGD